MKARFSVSITPCSESGIDKHNGFLIDDVYSCWTVVCKRCGTVLDHGSLPFAAVQLMQHCQKTHKYHDTVVER